ncbi:anthrone oxygenase family protein [Streptomyces sp. M41(2017)]|uniref:anthrone oxygenase family protein n=1 Tax=Streptomyces sp. M41(2017) TaxID=1955065 RepID=UPI00321A6701
MTTDANTTNTEHPTGTNTGTDLVRRRGTAAGVLGAATVAMGLIAGVFYIFACAIMPALARSDDRVFIEVMQNVNDVIQNPVFFLAFLGALVLTAVAAWQSRGAPHRWWVFAALAAYALAVALTAAVNIPLNDDLAAAGAPTRIAEPAAVRDRFEDTWVAWNVVRAVLSTVALACLARALYLFRRPQASAYLESAAGSSASR